MNYDLTINEVFNGLLINPMPNKKDSICYSVSVDGVKKIKQT